MDEKLPHKDTQIAEKSELSPVERENRGWQRRLLEWGVEARGVAIFSLLRQRNSFVIALGIRPVSLEVVHSHLCLTGL